MSRAAAPAALRFIQTAKGTGRYRADGATYSYVASRLDGRWLLEILRQDRSIGDLILLDRDGRSVLTDYYDTKADCLAIAAEFEAREGEEFTYIGTRVERAITAAMAR